MIFSLGDSSPEPHHWIGTSASSLSFSPPQFCHSCATHEPSSDRSFSCGFPSGFPSDVREPPCVWKKTGMYPCLCPPTRYCPSYRHSLKGPTGTGTNGSSFYCLLEISESCTITHFKLICTVILFIMYRFSHINCWRLKKQTFDSITFISLGIVTK